MRSSKGYDKSVFQSERNIEADESARAFTKIPNVVLPIRHVVFNYHVSVTDTVVLVLLNDHVVVDVSLC